MFGLCKLCGMSGEKDLFYSNSKSRCRDCTNTINRLRYQTRYREQYAKFRRAEQDTRKRIPVTLSEVDRAYAAGLIDGEGCIRITVRGASGGTQFRVGQRTLMVEVTNTDQAMLLWLQDRFGGSISYAPENLDLNRRERWHWRVAANKALYCLDAIWPYIKTKRRQAKLGRRFQRYVQFTGRALSEKRDSLMSRFDQELRALNKRGLR
jgi:hypothetical protein